MKFYPFYANLKKSNRDLRQIQSKDPNFKFDTKNEDI